MAFQKGRSGNPAGRPRGAQNKTTAILRNAVALLVEKNASKMDGWLDRIAEDDPRAAFQLMIGLMDFTLPKYARTPWFEGEETDNDPVPDAQIDHILQMALEAVQKAKDFENGSIF